MTDSDQRSAQRPRPPRSERPADALSPYVRAHAGGPITWHTWGAAAFRHARDEDRPIFLSIGYSTCYWCHVMAQESFSEPAIAEALAPFVAIVVDREERPDVDEVYMAATQLLTHRGGWPNHLFLTPEGLPYFAGTYFPPVERHGQPGLYQVARSMADAWERRRAEVYEQGEELAAVMHRFLLERAAPSDALAGEDTLAGVVTALAERYDDEEAGFGRSPKFPPHASLGLLTVIGEEPGSAGGRGGTSDPARSPPVWPEDGAQRLEPAGRLLNIVSSTARRAVPAADSRHGLLDTGSRERAETMLAATLDRMARGGIHDQVGGGFHRYTVDRRWRVPQLEKTLVDNALLLEIYARRAVTGDAVAARVARGIVGFLERDLATSEGAFRTAVSAESSAADATTPFHAWEDSELRRVLGPEDHSFLAPLFGFDGPPFFEERYYILHQPLTLDEQAARRQMSAQRLWDEIEPLLARLRETRARRPQLWVDPKVLTDGNGMAIAALATAGRLLGEPAWIEGAARAAEFVTTRLRTAAGLFHVWSDGEVGIAAQLADYAHLLRGLVALHSAGEVGWLELAGSIAGEMEKRLGDRSEDGRPKGFFTAVTDPLLRWRSKDVFDAALPSANGAAALALVELAAATDEPRWRELAAATLRAFAGTVEQQPESARSLATATLRFRALERR